MGGWKESDSEGSQARPDTARQVPSARKAGQESSGLMLCLPGPLGGSNPSALATQATRCDSATPKTLGCVIPVKPERHPSFPPEAALPHLGRGLGRVGGRGVGRVGGRGVRSGSPGDPDRRWGSLFPFFEGEWCLQLSQSVLSNPMVGAFFLLLYYLRFGFSCLITLSWSSLNL